tara:strand:- start:7260 stop:7448 length:189 start_codon:yes stop_codon:yes gene_type:complete
MTKLLTLSEAKAYSGLTRRDLDFLVDEGRIAVVIPQKQKRKFIKKSIDEYLEQEVLKCQNQI